MPNTVKSLEVEVSQYSLEKHHPLLKNLAMKQCLCKYIWDAQSYKKEAVSKVCWVEHTDCLQSYLGSGFDSRVDF